jgi:hypothetical protein
MKIKVKGFDLEHAGLKKINKLTTESLQKLEVAIQNHEL